jgi:hypothetical protein
MELTVHDFKYFIKANKVKDNEIIYIETDRSDVTCEANKLLHVSYVKGKPSLYIKG